MSKIGQTKKAHKKVVDFEMNPPRCTNCSNFNPPKYGVPNKKFYRAPQCKLHDFEVRPHSICDSWVGISGEVLERV